MSVFDAVDGASSAASKWYRMIASKPERFKEVMPGNEMAFEVFKELARTRRRNADTVDPGIGRTRLGQRTLKCVAGPTPPDLEEILRRGQDKLRRVLPGGNLGGRGFALVLLGVIALWGFSGFFRVEPDELGVVLRFGREVREVQPGLNYHLPYPIETVLTPKALRVNKIDIGMRVVDDIRRGGTTVRDVPEESLMLTGDENIVDVDFSVLWKVK